MNLEFKPGETAQYVVQARLESQRAWLTITAPKSDLERVSIEAKQFADEVGVTTRIKKVVHITPKMDYIKHIRRNRAVFEPDGYLKWYKEIGAVPASHQIKRDTTATEQHQMLEDFG